MVKICKTCRIMFEITERDQQRYQSRGWPKPRHCPRCRQLRKDPLLRQYPFYKIVCI